MTTSKDGNVEMFLLVEENFDKLEKETGVPAETWATAYEYDMSFDLRSKVYVVPRKPEDDPQSWRQMVAELIYDIDTDKYELVVWPDGDVEWAALLMERYGKDDPSRHYLLLDVTLSTEVNI